MTEHMGAARNTGNTLVSQYLGQCLPGNNLHSGAGQCHRTLSQMRDGHPEGAETGLQAHRRDKHQSGTAGPTDTRDNQMAKGKYRSLITEIKAIWHHLNPIIPQQQVLDAPTHQKRKI